MTAVLSLRELGEQLAAKRTQVREIVTTHTVEGELKMNQATVEDLRARNAELKEIGERYDAMKEAEEVRKSSFIEEEKGERFAGGDFRQSVAGGAAVANQGRTLKEMIVASEGFKRFQAGEVKKYQIHFTPEETKTLLTLGDITPQADRRMDIVSSAQAYSPVTDLMRQGTTTSNALEYYEETIFTNNAAETAEGATKPESALDFTLRTDPIRKIATWIPVTDEVLSDNARLESYIRGRLRFMVIKRREQQVLIGDGIAPNLLGIELRSGIQNQAKGTDPVFDAVLKAMVKVQTTGDAMPNGIIMHPNDWADLRLTRTPMASISLAIRAITRPRRDCGARVSAASRPRPRIPRSSATSRWPSSSSARG